MIYAVLLPYLAILLGGITQVLQKLMMVVRPKAASKVFKFAPYPSFPKFVFQH